MKLHKYERETIINYSDADGSANVYTHDAALTRRLQILSTDYPEQCVLLRRGHDDKASEYSVPKRWIKIKPPRKMSEAQQQALSNARAKSAAKHAACADA